MVVLNTGIGWHEFEQLTFEEIDAILYAISETPAGARGAVL
jgi:hypothetical protein